MNSRKKCERLNKSHTMEKERNNQNGNYSKLTIRDPDLYGINSKKIIFQKSYMNSF